MRSASGSMARTSRNTARPPTPESKRPIIGSGYRRLSAAGDVGKVDPPRPLRGHHHQRGSRHPEVDLPPGALRREPEPPGHRPLDPVAALTPVADGAPHRRHVGNDVAL